MPFGFSARPVQIATSEQCAIASFHVALPPHAPCRLQPPLLLSKWREDFFASTRSVQIATAEMHRIAIYTFQNAC